MNKLFITLVLGTLLIGTLSASTYSDCSIYGNCNKVSSAGNVTNYNNYTIYQINQTNNITNTIYQTQGVNNTQLENATVISIKESWLDSLYVRISNIVSLVGNWTNDKVNYYNKSEVDNNLSLYTTSSNQAWNKTGSSVYLNNPNDKVGIGVSSPGFALQLNGTFAILNSSASLTDEMIMGRDSFSHLAIAFDDTSAYLTHYNDNDENQTHKTVFNIVSKSYISPVMNYSGATYSFRINGQEQVFFGSGVAYSNYFRNKIGIGTSTPTQILDVRGNGNFSGTIYINNVTDITTYANNGLTISVNLTNSLGNPCQLNFTSGLLMQNGC